MVYLHVSANVGTLGKGDRISTPDSVSEVRRNVLNVLKRIKEDHGKYPDSMGIQEVGVFDVELSPVFGTPFATDERVRAMKGGLNMIRGVATYGDGASSTRPDPVGDAFTAREYKPLDNQTEIVTTVHDISFSNGRGKKDHKVGIINVYRLMNKGVECTPLRESGTT